MPLAEDVKRRLETELWRLLETYHPAFVKERRPEDGVVIVKEQLPTLIELANKMAVYERLEPAADMAEIIPALLIQSAASSDILFHYFVLVQTTMDRDNVRLNADGHYRLGSMLTQIDKTNTLEISKQYYLASKSGHVEARAALEALSHHGDADGHYYLAVLLEEEPVAGAGVSKHNDKIAGCYYHAAVSGHAKAKEALERLTAAGLKEANYFLGMFYESGPTSSRDSNKAAMYYFEACQKGQIPAIKFLAGLKGGVVLLNSLAEPYCNDYSSTGSPEALRKLEELARYTQNIYAQTYLAYVYYEAYTSTSDPEALRKLQRLAIQRQNGYAQFCLGYICESRSDSEKSFSQALACYCDAVRNLCVEALEHLHGLLKRGRIKQNFMELLFHSVYLQPQWYTIRSFYQEAIEHAVDPADKIFLTMAAGTLLLARHKGSTVCAPSASSTVLQRYTGINEARAAVPDAKEGSVDATV